MTALPLPPKLGRVLALLQDGLSIDQIAPVIGSTRGSVKTMAAKLRRQGLVSAEPQRVVPITLTQVDYDALRAEADRRSVSEKDLAAGIIRAVLHDGIVDAALGDA